ncbi:hypothetical protein [Paenibacillus sp. FSL L8-0463]|uniref:hypothetical protein n=1 Tax=Paenibacillus sp. FSL L8-0463 TaxID=2954687 RepID=UPI003119306C
MEEFYKEQYERVCTENNRVQSLLLEKFQEISDLNNEIRCLKEQVAGKPMTERERTLLRVAKQIVEELDHKDESAGM